MWNPRYWYVTIATTDLMLYPHSKAADVRRGPFRIVLQPISRIALFAPRFSSGKPCIKCILVEVKERELILGARKVR